MTTKSVLIQGGKEVFFDDSQVGAGALAQVLISADRKYVFKMEGVKGKDELQTLRELGTKLPPKSESRKLLLRVWGVEQHSFLQWQGAKMHVQECAPGKDLRSYALKGALSFEDRLHIAIQTATLFKETNEAGAAYLDHKPREHVYWDADNRVIKVIDWNAAPIKATEAERAEDFASYCMALADILDTNPHEENETGMKSYRYLSHPLNWSLDTENALHHKYLGYRSWFLLALTSLTVTGKPFLQNWTELLQVFSDVRDRKNSWLESIVKEHSSDDDLARASLLIGQLLESDVPTTTQREEAQSLADTLMKKNRLGKKADEIGESKYQLILYRSLFARLLSPSHFRTFCLFEVWRLFLTNPEKAHLCQLFLDLQNPNLTWEDYVKNIKESSDASKITSLEKLKQKADAQEKIEKTNRLISENKLSEAMSWLNQVKTTDPDNIDIQIQYNNIKGSDEVQSVSEEILRSAKSVLENTGDWEDSLSKVKEVETMWQGGKMPEHIQAQVQSLWEQIELAKKSKNKQSETTRKLKVMLSQNPTEQTSTQVRDFLENISSEIETPEHREMFAELQKRYDDIVTREKQVNKLNSAATFETWRSGLAEAAKNGNLRAKDDLINANLIGKVLENIQHDIKQIPNVGLDASTRSYLAVQKELSKLRETLKGEETSLRFLGEVEGELPALKDAILQQAGAIIRDLLIKRERTETDIENAKKILVVISGLGGQEPAIREMADWLEHCRLIEEMKRDLNKWEQLSDEIIKLPSEIFNGAYYENLRQRVRNVTRAKRLIELTPSQWADDIQSLKEQWRKDKQLGMVERELYRKLVEAEQKAGFDASERNKIDSLQQAQQAFDAKLSESEKALKSEVETLQAQLKFLLSEKQFQALLNKSNDSLKNIQKENVEELRKHIDVISADLGKRVESTESTEHIMREIQLGNQNLVNSLKNLVTQDQLNTAFASFSPHFTVDISPLQKDISHILTRINSLEDAIKSIKTELSSNPYGQDNVAIRNNKDDNNKPATDSGGNKDSKPRKKRPNFPVDWQALTNTQKIIGAGFVVLVCLMSLIGLGLIYNMASSGLPVVSQFNPTETATPTATLTPTSTPTFTPTMTPIPKISLSSNLIQSVRANGSPVVKLQTAPGSAFEVNLTQTGKIVGVNNEITLTAALKSDSLSNTLDAIQGQDYAIKPIDDKAPLKLYCIAPNTTEPVECGEYTYSKDAPDTFKVSSNSALPAGYVWLEWIIWIPQSAIN